MSLKTVLRLVTVPNYTFIEWLESIENIDRRLEIVYNIGINALKYGSSDEYINDTYWKLASECGPKLIRLSDDEIAYHLSVKDVNRSAASEDDEVDSVSDTSSGGSSSSTGENKKTSETEHTLEDNVNKLLNKLAVSEKDTDGITVSNSSAAFENPDNTLNFDLGRNNHSCENSTSLSGQKSNIEKSVSVEYNAQANQNKGREKTNCQDNNGNHSIGSFAVKDNLKLKGDLRQMDLEKANNELLHTTTPIETIKVARENSSYESIDKTTTGNVEKVITNKKSIERISTNEECTNTFLSKQMDKLFPTVNDKIAMPSNYSGKLKEISNLEGLSNLNNLVSTSNPNLKPSITVDDKIATKSKDRGKSKVISNLGDLSIRSSSVTTSTPKNKTTSSGNDKVATTSKDSQKSKEISNSGGVSSPSSSVGTSNPNIKTTSSDNDKMATKSKDRGNSKVISNLGDLSIHSSSVRTSSQNLKTTSSGNYKIATTTKDSGKSKEISNFGGMSNPSTSVRTSNLNIKTTSSDNDKIATKSKDRGKSKVISNLGDLSIRNSSVTTSKPNLKTTITGNEKITTSSKDSGESKEISSSGGVSNPSSSVRTSDPNLTTTITCNDKIATTSEDNGMSTEITNLGGVSNPSSSVRTSNPILTTTITCNDKIATPFEDNGMSKETTNLGGVSNPSSSVRTSNTILKPTITVNDKIATTSKDSGESKEISSSRGVSNPSSSVRTSNPNLKTTIPSNDKIVTTSKDSGQSKEINNLGGVTLEDSAKSKDVCNLGGVSNRNSSVTISSQNFKLTISKEELQRMKILKEKLDEKINEKNVVLSPPSKLQILLGRDNSDFVHSMSNVVRDNNQKRKISQDEQHTPRKSNKDKEQQKYIEQNSNQSAHSSRLENCYPAVKELTAQLENIKKIVESRKRVSLDPAVSTENVKKGRFSNQSQETKNCSERASLGKVHTGTSQLEINQRPGNQPMRLNLPQATTKLVNKHSATGVSQSINEERISIDTGFTSNDSLLEVNVNSDNQQNLTISDGNIRDSSTFVTSSHSVPTHPTAPVSASKQTTVANSLIESVKESVSLLLRQPNTGVGRDCSSGSLQTNETNVESRANISNCNFPVMNSTVPHSSIPISEDRTGPSQVGNRVGLNSFAVPTNNQSLPVVEAARAVAGTSNQMVVGRKLPSELNQIIDGALNYFFLYFNNKTNDPSIPQEILFNLNEYLFNLKRPPTKNLPDCLKFYIMCYIRIFDHGDLNQTICKTAELLHLSIADIQRKNDRLEKAKKLQSNLRNEETEGAKQDYEEIRCCRGKRMSDLFTSLLAKFLPLKGSHFVLLTTFYLKITQALTKIDVENNKYFTVLREIIKSLLMSSNPSIIAQQSWFFEIDNARFERSCRFVKQCLMTLYMSGYHDKETEAFWELVNYEPIIPNLKYVMDDFKKKTQMKSRRSFTISQNDITLKSILKSNSYIPPTNDQIPMNQTQQTPDINCATYFPNQLNQPTSSQNAARQQISQPVQPPQVLGNQSLMPGVGAHPRLPPFASFNHPHLLSQQLRQINTPVLNRIQGNPGYHRQPDPRLQQRPDPTSSAPAQPQSNIRVASPSFLYPTPPHTTNTSANQQQTTPEGRSTNVQPQTNHVANQQNMMQNVSTDETTRQYPCSTAGCRKQATLICSSCKEALYCTTDCQTIDWYQDHSKKCLGRTS